MSTLRASAFKVRAATVLAALSLLLPWKAWSGGPFIVGGPGTAIPGQAYVWNVSTPIPYRTDGGALGSLSNALANARVQAMFQVWQDVPTANISFSRAGAITGVDGDVNSVAEFNTVEGSCNSGSQNPIVYDANGTLFTALGFSSGVIGFAGPCALSAATGRILSGEAALNGKWIDGNAANGELTAAQFDETFIHEFGHFSGLDHSQINLEVLNQPSDNCNVTDLAGLPLLFPFAHCQARLSAGLPNLAPDDLAWISRLYPETVDDPGNGRIPFDTAYGTISGAVLFSDGLTPLQGGNVIARKVGDARRVAVSAVSGYRFTGNPGQGVTGTNSEGSADGSRDPLLIGVYDIPAPVGDYLVEVEAIDPAFVGGSSVGPLGFYAGEQFPLPGPAESWNLAESATDNPSAADPVNTSAGATTGGIDIILNGTPARFDPFEDGGP